MNTFSTIRKAVSLTSALSLALAFGLSTAQASENSHSGMANHAVSAASSQIQAMGTVKKVMVSEGMIKLQHEPITALGWPSMTMNFTVKSSVDLSGYKKGQSVHFTLEMQADGNYVITEMMGMSGMKH